MFLRTLTEAIQAMVAGFGRGGFGGGCLRFRIHESSE